MLFFYDIFIHVLPKSKSYCYIIDLKTGSFRNLKKIFGNSAQRNIVYLFTIYFAELYEGVMAKPSCPST
jgi:hypothetical protein